MKRILILLLTLGIVCCCLYGCVDPVAEPETTSTDLTEMTLPEEVETVTMPQIEMPTQPDADYQLPPGEKPGGDVITE